MDDRNPSLTPDLRAELQALTDSLCKVLNEHKRLMLLYALAAGPRSVGELTTQLQAPQANVSQHLALLREHGLVDTQRDGPRVIYSLRYPELVGAVDALREVLRREFDRRAEVR
jgi:DNA-binding transcriptional ArsR family regulator